jgi:outer membrane protein assembly factor BamB
MSRESLEDHLRRATRHFTVRLPENDLLALGRDLLRELARAHAESPPRHPEIEPSRIALVDGKPVLEGGETTGDVAEDLLQLGALIQSLAAAAPADVSWRLDGPPPADLSTLERRATLIALSSPRSSTRYASAAEAAAALEAALAPASDTAPPWPLFRGDASRTGQRTASARSGLSPAWDTPVGAVIASPVLTARLALAAGSDGRLHFLDRETGRRLHEMKLASALESSPALVGTVAHLGTDDGEVVGVDVLAGKETYRFKAGKLVRSSPLVHDGRVFVGVMDTKDAGALVCLDAATGKLVWRRKLGAVFSSPTLAGERVLVGSDDGSLHAVDRATGALVWSHKLGGRVRATAAVAGELAVIADFDGRVAAVRIADGTRVWLRELGQPVYASPCLAGALVVLGCHDAGVHGLALSSGEPAFRAQTGGPVVSSPVALGELLVAASTDGALYLLDATGRVLTRTAVASEGIQSSPAADDAVLLLGSARGVHAFRFVQ